MAWHVALLLEAIAGGVFFPLPLRFRANLERISQSRPDHGLGVSIFQCAPYPYPELHVTRYTSVRRQVFQIIRGVPSCSVAWHVALLLEAIAGGVFFAVAAARGWGWGGDSESSTKSCVPSSFSLSLSPRSLSLPLPLCHSLTLSLPLSLSPSLAPSPPLLPLYLSL